MIQVTKAHNAVTPNSVMVEFERLHLVLVLTKDRGRVEYND